MNQSEKRGAPQLDVQELELEQPQDSDKGTQKASLNPEDGTQEALPDPEEETREVPLDSGQETRKGPSDRKDETRKAPSDPDEETREAPSDPNEETRGAPSNPEKETQKAPSDSEKETKDVAGLAAGPTYLEGLVVPARQKFTISGNLPPNKAIAHVELTGVRRRERSSAATLLPTNEKATRNVCRCATAGARQFCRGRWKYLSR